MVPCVARTLPSKRRREASGPASRMLLQDLLDYHRGTRCALLASRSRLAPIRTQEGSRIFPTSARPWAKCGFAATFLSMSTLDPDADCVRARRSAILPYFEGHELHVSLTLALSVARVGSGSFHVERFSPGDHGYLCRAERMK